MHVEASQTYTMLMSARGAHAAPTDADDNDETTRQDSATATAREAANNAVSGATGSRMSAEMDRTLIGQQEVDETASAPTREESKTESPYLWEIANNAEFAAEQAHLIGNSYDGIFYPTEYFESFTKAGKMPPGGIVFNNPDHPVNQVQKKRAELYDSLVAKGMSSIDIIKEIYRFNANLPASFTDTLDPAGYYPKGHYNTLQKSNLALLEQYIEEAQGPDGTVASQAQETDEISTRDTSLFDKLNFVSESDRRLLSAMTGYSVDSFGRFTDKNGKQGYPEDLTQHSLRSFQMALLGARSGRSADAIAGKDITKSEFIELMNQSRAVASSMGEKFNEDLLIRGLAYLEKSEASTRA
jgi:hypothetical protein